MRYAATLSAVTLALALTGCGGSSEDQEPEPQVEDSSPATQEVSTPESQAVEDSSSEDDADNDDEGSNGVSELIEEENRLFDLWIDAPADSEQEADLQAQLDDVYDELGEHWGDIDSEEDAPEEIYDAALVQYLMDMGLSLEEIIDGGEVGAGGGTDDAVDSPDDLTSSVEAEIGETVEVYDSFYSGAPDGSMGTITLEGIERPVDPAQCPDGLGGLEEPQQGEFVALHMALDADPAVGDVLSVSESDFYIVDENDTMLRDEIVSYEAWVCADRLGSLQAAQPGTNTSGIVMLDTDVSEGAGTLVFQGLDTEITWQF